MSQHTLSVVLMEDRPDALAHLVSLLHRRAFQVTSLAYGTSERPGVVRLTLGMDFGPAEAERLERELQRSMHVLAVDSLIGAPEVHRELLLVKVSTGDRRRAEILQLAEVFRAGVIDIAEESVSLELTGNRDKLDALVRILEPYGVLELTRTGPVAMGRGPEALAAHDQNTSWLDRQDHKSCILPEIAPEIAPEEAPAVSPVYPNNMTQSTASSSQE